MGKIAVITPTRDRAGSPGRIGYLEQAIYSVREQKGADYVHVIVDDGSTDRTADLVGFHRKEDPRIVYIHRDKPPTERQTASFANNVGIKSVLYSQSYPGQDGEMLGAVDYLCLLHSDDLLSEGSLEERAGILDGDEKTWMVYGSMHNFNNSEPPLVVRELNVDPTKPLARIYDDFLARVAPFSNHSVMTRLELLRDIELFDENVSYGEDRDMSLLMMRKCMENGYDVTGTPNCVYYYRVHDDTVTSWARRNRVLQKDIARVTSKHSTYRTPLWVLQTKRFLRKPHAFLPEPIKAPLRKVRDRVRERKNNIYTTEYLSDLTNRGSEFWEATA